MYASWIAPFVDFVFGLGLFANALMFIPQVYRLWSKKNADGLSLITFGGFNIMQFFTAWHGYLIHDYLLFIGFVLSFITCGLVTLGIIVFGNNPTNA